MIDMFKQVFDELDTDHSGMLNLEEMKTAFTKKKQIFDERQVEGMMKLVD